MTVIDDIYHAMWSDLDLMTLAHSPGAKADTWYGETENEFISVSWKKGFLIVGVADTYYESTLCGLIIAAQKNIFKCMQKSFKSKSKYDCLATDELLEFMNWRIDKDNVIEWES